MLLDESNYFRAFFTCRQTIGLESWTKVLRPCQQELFFAARADKFDSGLVATQEHSGLRIKQPNRIGAPLEQAFEDRPGLLEKLLGRARAFENKLAHDFDSTKTIRIALVLSSHFVSKSVSEKS